MSLLAQVSQNPDSMWQHVTPTGVFWYLYVLIGIGLYGGYEFWGFFGKALYWCCFPIHASVFGLAILAWQYVTLAVADIRYVTAPAIFFFILGFALLALGPVFGFLFGTIAGSIVTYRHWTAGKT
jgi:hypothetical protein